MASQQHRIQWSTVAAVILVVAMTPGFTSACPFPVDDSVRVVENFDVSRFEGDWYEVAFKKPSIDTFATLHNVAERISSQGEGRLLSQAAYTVEDALNCMSFNKTLTYNADEPAKMKSTFYFNETASVLIDYWVLHTDYDHYALVWGCNERDMDGACADSYGWVLGRETALSETAQNMVKSQLAEICEQEPFEDISHTMACLTPISAAQRGAVLHSWLLLASALLCAVKLM